MLIIDETIYLERKTTGILSLIIDDYILRVGDTVEIKINPEDTEQLEPSCYFYGITLKMANGDVFPIIKTNKFIVERVIPNV